MHVLNLSRPTIYHFATVKISTKKICCIKRSNSKQKKPPTPDFFKALCKPYKTLARKGKLQLCPRSESSAVLSRQYIRRKVDQGNLSICIYISSLEPVVFVKVSCSI